MSSVLSYPTPWSRPIRILTTREDDAAPPTIKAPKALTLTTEPQANVERYDACAKSGRRAMRHDPTSGAIIIMLRSLKMHGMAQAVGELTEQGSRPSKPPC